MRRDLTKWTPESLLAGYIEASQLYAAASESLSEVVAEIERRGIHNPYKSTGYPHVSTGSESVRARQRSVR